MVLDFEKPIVELETKLEEMRRIARENDVDVSASVAALEEKINEQMLRQWLVASESPEQRHRLLRVAEHHVIRVAREQAFGKDNRPQLEDPFDSAAVGFSYDAVYSEDNPVNGQMGVVVRATMPGFPGHAYLRPGDIIYAVNGQRAHPNAGAVTSWISIQISQHRPGNQITFSVVRDKKATTVRLTATKSSALNAMYKTDQMKASSRSRPFNDRWLQALERLTKDLPEPKTLEHVQ